MADATARHDWSHDEASALFDLPFNELLHGATKSAGRTTPQRGAGSRADLYQDRRLPRGLRLLSASGVLRHRRGAQKLIEIDDVLERARAANAADASRFCMGAAWRGPKDRDIPKAAALVGAVAETWRRDKLAALIARFRHGADELDLPLTTSSSAIQSLMLRTAAAATTAMQAPDAQGLLATVIRPPAVRVGQVRLRITVSAAHEEAHVDWLLDAWKACACPATRAEHGRPRIMGSLPTRFPACRSSTSPRINSSAWTICPRCASGC